LAGAIAAFFAVKLTDWRMAYFIGGGMGLILLILRVNVLESIVFNKSLEKRGSKVSTLVDYLYQLVAVCKVFALHGYRSADLHGDRYLFHIWK
jgi:MFS family permease